MRFWFQLLAVTLAGLAGLAAVSAAAPGERRVAAAARPSISKISPITLASGQRMSISGRLFVPGRRKNRVIFLGRAGRADDFLVRATVVRGRTIRLKTRRGAPSGRVQVVNRNGRSRPSRARVTFDDDRDGLSNERERQLGTNPLAPDTDGDGIPDGTDPDPLHPPPSPGPEEPGGGGGTPSTDCPGIAVAGPGAGPGSVFEGLENVIQEGRSLISHSAHAGALRYCLYRKRRSQPDSDYQLVGDATDPAAGVIRDGQRPSKSEDYLYRTDVVTSDGPLAGSNTVGARGAGSIANVSGWAQINQTCTSCGGAAVQGGVLKAAARGDGTAGPPVGQVAVYRRRLELASGPPGVEWLARALTPLTPSAPGSYSSANLTISDEHPATARGTGTVADVTRSDSDRPFINLELRARQDGELRVMLTDSNGTVEYPNDLRAEFGVVQNVYLVVTPEANGEYRAGFSANGGTGVDFVIDREIPDGMTSAWLSLRTELSREETGEFDARFDDTWATGQPNTPAPDDSNLDENFGGTTSVIQVPVGFDAQPIADGLSAPTAVEFAPDGDMFIAERGGRLKLRAAGTGAISEVLDISADVGSEEFADQGLLGFALDPGFVGDGGTNDWAYISYTVEANPAQPDDTIRTVARVQRVKFNGTSFDPATRTTLVGADGAAPGTGDTCPPATTSDCLPADAYTHTAGGLAFGTDGKLWISVPDGADPDPGAGDPLALRAQNDDSLAGKLLRVDPVTGDGVVGNPSYDPADTDSPASRTWVKGFRNPFRLAQRPDGTHAWYITDVGWQSWEEANVVPSSAAPTADNYGWPCYEGAFASTAANFAPSSPGCTPSPTNHEPLHAYDSSGADHAIIGGAFYTGSAWPVPWRAGTGGAAFYYSDYPSGELTRLETDAADAKVSLQAFASGFSGPVEVAEGPADFAAPAGETAIYVVNIGDVTNPSATDGKVWRIVQTAP